MTIKLQKGHYLIFPSHINSIVSIIRAAFKEFQHVADDELGLTPGRCAPAL
jgi:hypothetical protein